MTPQASKSDHLGAPEMSPKEPQDTSAHVPVRCVRCACTVSVRTLYMYHQCVCTVSVRTLCMYRFSALKSQRDLK